MPDAEDRTNRRQAAERVVDQAQHDSERRSDLATAEIIQAGAAAQANRLESVAREMVAAAEQQVQRDWRNRALLGGIAVMAAIAAVGTWASYRISHSNAQILAQVRETSDRVESCTTPDGECSKRGQQAQAQAIGQIVAQFSQVDAAYSLIVAECAHEGTPSQVVTCFHAKARQAGLEK